MNAGMERKVIRWFHILASVPIMGMVYGPVAGIPEAARAVRWGIFPAVVLSGLWLWKGAWVKGLWRKARGPGGRPGLRTSGCG